LKRLGVILGCTLASTNFNLRIKTAAAAKCTAYVVSGTPNEKAYGEAVLDKMFMLSAGVKIEPCEASHDTLSNLRAIGHLGIKYDDVVIVTDRIHAKRVNKYLEELRWKKDQWHVKTFEGPVGWWVTKKYEFEEWCKRRLILYSFLK